MQPLALASLLVASALAALAFRAIVGRQATARVAEAAAATALPTYESLVRARFEVRDRFFLRPRRALVVAGRILEGEVQPGMTLLVPVLGRDDVVGGLRVLAVEAVDYRGGDPSVGLVLDCRTQREADAWAGTLRTGLVADLLASDPAP